MMPQDKLIVDLKERFWKNVDILDGFATDEDCWLWTGSKISSGYGQIFFRGKMRLVHRISYWIYKDYCQSNLLREEHIKICHSCNCPLCINPGHLFIGNDKINADQRTAQGRTFSKLTKEQVIKIKELLKNKVMLQKNIAKMFNIGTSQLSRIKHNHLWKHLKIYL